MYTVIKLLKLGSSLRIFSQYWSAKFEIQTRNVTARFGCTTYTYSCMRRSPYKAYGTNSTHTYSDNLEPSSPNPDSISGMLVAAQGHTADA